MKAPLNVRLMPVTVLFLMGCFAATVQPQPAPVVRTDMSVIEARGALRKALISMPAGYTFACCGREKMQIYDSNSPADLMVNANGYSFIERGRFGVMSNTCLFCTPIWGPSGPYEWNMNVKFGGRYVDVRECKKQYGVVVFGTKQWMMGGVRTWKTQAEAQAFVDAFNVLNAAFLNRDPARDAAEFAAFEAEAKQWRESASRPALPDGAYREKVLAEESIREKDLEAAILHYHQGLKIHPLWPEGHFNLALLEAEFLNYHDAVRHMKRYLALMPDAPDAQAARDKLIIWENKAQTQK